MTEQTDISLRPDHVPEKFWNAETGEVRVDALTKSYCDLERQMSRMVQAPELPETADGYELSLPDGLERAPDVDERLHTAGFSADQVQMVYELAAEVLGPMAADRAIDQERDALLGHFGGEQELRNAARDIRDWGKAHLPETVYGALATSAAGIKAMHAMMSNQEPKLGTGDGGGAAVLDKAGLRKLMDDPRYWRDGDPELVAQVRRGFAALSGPEK